MTNKEKVYKLLKGIETGDSEAASVVNESKYIQHNPHTQEGNVGLAELFKRLSKTGPKVTMVRAFEDSNYVFAHMQYDFSSVKVAFEVFRFEDGFAVEHWDNLQPIDGPNPSGHGMLDGPTTAEDHHLTEINRKLVGSYVNNVLIKKKLETISDFVCDKLFVQHNPKLADGLAPIRATLESKTKGNDDLKYLQLHRLLAEGNFVLSVCEGEYEGKICAFYDLYRIQQGKIVEHWDTIEEVPPRSEWKNDNGKF
ncbi:nuclear transport factor 2 family protein [Algicola sagamiensis]|uniref:nuclear transport factor 2 family protein n=1 Tax=Algicola sagamiensis TaxID=163869 RepID=UPI000367F38F|nr:hypothetical protein [Algicola sagamiensis]